MKNTSNFFYSKESHSFHLVDNSQLPVLTSFSTFFLACSFVFYLNPPKCGLFSMFDSLTMQISVVFLMAVLFSWFMTVVMESGKGYHTAEVRKGLSLGMMLFMLSEVMLFFSFFWAFFHVSLSPAMTLGCVWPPATMQALDLWGMPLVNTVLLLSSGYFLTAAHKTMLTKPENNMNKDSMLYLYLTMMLGTTFLFSQYVEYKYGVTFSWSDNVFGSIFYVTTGFHGFHVVIGTMFLMFCLVRLVCTTISWENMKGPMKTVMNYVSLYSFSKEQHIGFEAAAWYWHFVDVVWMFLFMTMYWWNSEQTMSVFCV